MIHNALPLLETRVTHPFDSRATLRAVTLCHANMSDHTKDSLTNVNLPKIWLHYVCTMCIYTHKLIDEYTRFFQIVTSNTKVEIDPIG